MKNPIFFNHRGLKGGTEIHKDFSLCHSVPSLRPLWFIFLHERERHFATNYWISY